MRNVIVATSAVLLAGISAPASAVTTLSAGWTEGCGKTTCFSDKGAFSKTWGAKDASGPVSVSSLRLDRSVLGALDDSTFRISFTLNGREVGTWGSYMMAGISGDTLSFTGSDFTWNPEDGDLVLVLQIAQPSKGGGGFLSSPQAGGGESGSVVREIASEEKSGSSPQEAPGQRAAVSAAPEPATWALMIGGFGIVGSRLRRRAIAVA